MLQIQQDKSGDFCCPKCSTAYRVEKWGTEYNDPLTGVSYVCCLKCKARFKIDVEVTVRITVDHTPDNGTGE